MEKSTLDDRLHIEYKGTRCPAHLYQLQQQGGEKSRYIYRCTREGCRHYATFTDIEGRVAQCRNCGNVFVVVLAKHIVRDPLAKKVEAFLEFEPHCCNTLRITEVDKLEFELE